MGLILICIFYSRLNLGCWFTIHTFPLYQKHNSFHFIQSYLVSSKKDSDTSDTRRSPKFNENEMTKKNPRTAHPNNSIWHPLQEDTFRRNLVTLEDRTNAVPIAPLVFDADEWERESATRSNHSTENDGDGLEKSVRGYILPLKVEQQLADEFASLAAVEEGAQSVAAVCVEEISHTSIHTPNQTPNQRQEQNPKTRKSLRLRFAALDTTLDSNIKSALLEISTLLCNHQIPRDESVERMFELVVALHERKLLARLRSKKWEKPRYLAKSHKKPLWKDFENLKHRTQFLYSKKEKPLLASILAHLETLGKVYEDFETLPGDEDAQRDGLKDLVLKSYDFTTSLEAKGYLKRLEDSIGKVATSQVSSAVKSLRQIQKIGSYRRICHSLVGISRRYQEVFEGGTEMEFLNGYEGVKTEIGFESWAGSMHIHAEIQLAVFYDLIFQRGGREVSPPPSTSQSPSEPQNNSSPVSSTSSHSTPNFLRPRAIGISKSLCFLCFQFLQKHRSFFPSRTHGRLYDQWTVPDLQEFSDETRRKYRRVLGGVDGEVRGLIEGEPEMWRVEPMTSWDVHCECMDGDMGRKQVREWRCEMVVSSGIFTK